MIKKSVIFILLIIILIVCINNYNLFDFLYTVNNYCFSDYNCFEVKQRYVIYVIKRFLKEVREQGLEEADDFAKIGYGKKKPEDDIDEDSAEILDADYIFPNNIEIYEKSFHPFELFVITLVIFLSYNSGCE
jgi:hypothetical protein